jgi:hypothetical protein
MVVDSDWKRVRVKTDLVAPWVALGALEGSEPCMMQVAEASKGRLATTTNLEGGHCQGKRVNSLLLSRCHLVMPVSYLHFNCLSYADYTPYSTKVFLARPTKVRCYTCDKAKPLSQV